MQPKPLLDVIGNLIIIAYVQDSPFLLFQLWPRKGKPRANTIGYTYQGYRADGNENIYSNFVAGSSKVTYKGQIWAEHENEGVGWLIGSWSFSREKSWEPPEDMPIRIPRGSHKKKCQNKSHPSRGLDRISTIVFFTSELAHFSATTQRAHCKSISKCVDWDVILCTSAFLLLS